MKPYSVHDSNVKSAQKDVPFESLSIIVTCTYQSRNYRVINKKLTVEKKNISRFQKSISLNNRFHIYGIRVFYLGRAHIMIDFSSEKNSVIFFIQILQTFSRPILDC